MCSIYYKLSRFHLKQKDCCTFSEEVKKKCFLEKYLPILKKVRSARQKQLNKNIWHEVISFLIGRYLSLLYFTPVPYLHIWLTCPYYFGYNGKVENGFNVQHVAVIQFGHDPLHSLLRHLQSSGNDIYLILLESY